jgi:nicotinamide-nucleotide amidase
MWFEKDEVFYMSMPGVPYEMKTMMETQVIPKIRDTFSLPVIVHRTFLTQGIGESMLSELITAWEDALPNNMKLAYLPSTGMVRLRITALGENEMQVASEVQQQATSLYNLIGQYIYGEGDQTIEAIIIDILRKTNKTLSIAESCTGGNIAHLLTSIPGASDAFVGGAVVYTSKMKIDILGVDPEILSKYGIVSEEVVREIANGSIQKFNSDFAISVSGVAGPGADKDGNPVGSVWIAIAGKDFTNAKKFQFSTNRARNITMASYAALNYLRKQLIA